LGRLQPNNNPNNRPLAQFFHAGTAEGAGIFTTDPNRIIGLVYWQRTRAAPLLYAWPGIDRLSTYTFNGTHFDLPLVLQRTFQPYAVRRCPDDADPFSRGDILQSASGAEGSL
jgi:hypothetical protein